MKTITTLILSFTLSFGFIYDFDAKTFFNKIINFKSFKKDIFVLFVAYDDCKLTKELKALNDLLLKQNEKVSFVGFAINEIKLTDKNICSINYGVDFDMFDKHGNDITKLNNYIKKVYLNKKIPLYSPIVMYDKKIIRLDSNISSLESAIKTAIKIRK